MSEPFPELQVGLTGKCLGTLPVEVSFSVQITELWVENGLEPITTKAARWHADSPEQLHWFIENLGTFINDVLPVYIDGRGRICLLDGHHRASAISLTNQTAQVFVRVVYTSPTWKTFVETLHSVHQGKRLYQPIDHPFFKDWALERDPARYAIIRRCIADIYATSEHQTELAIDYGSNYGYVTRMLEDIGYRAIGVESDSTGVKLAEYLNVVHNTNCTYRCTGDVELICSTYPPRAVELLCFLSLIHHWKLGWFGKDSEKLPEVLKWLLRAAKTVLLDIDDRCVGENFETQVVWLQTMVGKKLDCKLVGRTESRNICTIELPTEEE